MKGGVPDLNSLGSGHQLALASFPSDGPEFDRASRAQTRYISLREDATSCLTYPSTGEIPNAREPNHLSSRAYGRSVQIEGTTLHLGVSLVAVHSAPRYNTRKGGCVQKQVNINSEFRATLNTAQFLEKAPALFIEQLTTRAANHVQDRTI
jgi:hypothetical protein